MYQYNKAGHPSTSSERSKSGYTHLGNVALKEVATLGAGYSGEVKRVQDENGQLYALKVSNEKQIRFALADIPIGSLERCNMILQEASEFEKLRKLFAAGVPVPRPHSFQIHSNADGLGSTAVLMELVRGQTLRDWLSEQPGGKTDKLSGRSQHPAMTYADAIARVDVANCIIGALLKLRRLAFFADFKPRNIMIKEQRVDTERHFSACLVDIGGVVMYQDLSTEAAVRHTSCDRQPQLSFHPLRDRYLVSRCLQTSHTFQIETTCSYLSPEMALLIAEYDFWKRRLNNHYFRTRKELANVTDDVTAYQDLLSTISWGPGRRAVKTEWKVPDLKVIISYLEARKEFERIAVLNRSKTSSSLDANRQEGFLDMKIPCSDDLVFISEKSSVFTLGLILVELFGGKRTGLTSLTRLRHINDIFLGETGNAEFRMVMEWETSSALLVGYSGTRQSAHHQKCGCGLSSTSSTRCPNSTLSNNAAGHDMAEPMIADESGASAVHPASSELCSTAETSDGDSRPRVCAHCSSLFKPPSASYFEYYRQHAYPHEGLLAAWNVGESTAGKTLSSDHPRPPPEIASMIQTLLDNCLRFDPECRPSLLELGAKLSELRRELISVMLSGERSVHWLGEATAATRTAARARQLWATSRTDKSCVPP